MVAMESSAPALTDSHSQVSRKTNFSIAAIMSGLQARTEGTEAKLEREEPAEGLEKIIKKERKSKICESSNCSDLDSVRCALDNKELWDKFCEFGTEMIITRTGRRMFPTVRITFANIEMDPGAKYLVLLDIPPCDNKRYRYAYHRSSWLVAGKADPAPPHRLHSHPDGPFTAEQLRKQVIGFEKVKITNNESDNTGQVILNSMHKFQPRVYLVKRREGETGPVQDIEKEKYRTFVFPETQFTAVTAYQNQCITKLKIESNPFAKGFRDSAGSDYDDQSQSGYPGFPTLPGGMPGMDPFARLRFPGEQNNNLMAAAEKARMMMMQPNPAFLPAPPTSSPSLPYSLPLSPELLARYSAIQASLGLYNPAFLAAALRTSTASTMPPSSLNSSLSSPRSPDLPSPPTNPHRFSPYILPRHSTPPESPRSPKVRSPSPGISPPPQFSSQAFPLLR